MNEPGREYIRLLLCLALLLEGPEIAYGIVRKIESWRDRIRRENAPPPAR